MKAIRLEMVSVERVELAVLYVSLVCIWLCAGQVELPES